MSIILYLAEVKIYFFNRFFFLVYFSENITIISNYQRKLGGYTLTLYAEDAKRFICFNKQWKLIGMVSFYQKL